MIQTAYKFYLMPGFMIVIYVGLFIKLIFFAFSYFAVFFYLMEH